MRGYSSTRIMKITSRFTMMDSVGILQTGEQIIAIKFPQSLTRYNGNRPIPLWRNMWLHCLPYPLCNLHKMNMIQLTQGVRYFSTFSGIGGFELGIKKVYETTRNTNVQKIGGREKNEKGELQEDGEGLHPISTETTIAIANRGNEYLNRSINEGQPRCIGFSEIDKHAVSIYQKHFPEHKNYGDITKINAEELPNFDLLVGGFPCQAFSIAGKRGGFDDTRGTLFFDLARILKAKQPRLFVFENVKGLLSHDEGRTFRTIISTLDELGYDLQWQVLNSKNHRVPQNRERVFIIGHLRGTSRPQVFPIGQISEGFSKQDNSSEILPSKKTGSITYADKPLLQTIGERPLHIRRLTPTECERLQGFPDGWTEGISDTQRYKTLGNAVTVNVIEDIMVKLLTKL